MGSWQIAGFSFNIKIFREEKNKAEHDFFPAGIDWMEKSWRRAVEKLESLEMSETWFGESKLLHLDCFVCFLACLVYFCCLFFFFLLLIKIYFIICFLLDFFPHFFFLFFLILICPIVFIFVPFNILFYSFFFISIVKKKKKSFFFSFLTLFFQLLSFLFHFRSFLFPPPHFFLLCMEM